MHTLKLLADFGKRFWPWILAFTLSALIIWVYLSGWRLGTDPIVYRNGAIVFNTLPPGSTIYIDDARRHTGVTGGADTHVKEGRHTVIIDAPGFQPWNEMVEVTKNTNVVLNPILVPKIPVSNEIPEKDSMLMRALKSNLPTADSRLDLKDSCVSVYESFGRLIAAPMEGCTPPAYLCSEDGCAPTVIYAPKDRIRTVTNYRGRSDALLIASGTGVYVLEIDPHSPQFFAPLYQGIAPRVVNLSPLKITIIDQDKTFVISL